MNEGQWTERGALNAKQVRRVAAAERPDSGMSSISQIALSAKHDLNQARR